MSDLIERQAAIGLIHSLYPSAPIMRRNRERWEEKYKPYIETEKALEMLPSAKPEIIHCKDCKHRNPEDKKCDCGHDILWQLPRQDDWYCADAERKIDE